MSGNRDNLLEAGKAMGPLAELARQVKQGKLSAEQLQAVVEGKNPFKKRQGQVLIFHAIGKKEYEGFFEVNKDEFAYEFDCDFHLPIGSTIALTSKSEKETIYFEIIDYYYEDDCEDILVHVKVSDKFHGEIHEPKDVSKYLKNNWTCGSRNLKKTK